MNLTPIWKPGLYSCAVLLWKMQSTTDRSEVRYTGTTLTCFSFVTFWGVKTTYGGWSFSVYEEDKGNWHGQKEQPKYEIFWNIKAYKTLCHPSVCYSGVKRLCKRWAWSLMHHNREKKEVGVLFISVYLPRINNKKVSRNMKWIFMRMLDIKTCSLSWLDYHSSLSFCIYVFDF